MADTEDIPTTNAAASVTAEDAIVSESEMRIHDSTNAGIEVTARISESGNIATSAETEAAAPQRVERGVAAPLGRTNDAIDLEVEALHHPAVTEGMSESGIGIGDVQGRNIVLRKVGGVDLLIHGRGIERVDEGEGKAGRGGDEMSVWCASGALKGRQCGRDWAFMAREL
jgi:hypothetical protein